MSRKNDAKSGKTDSKADNFALPKDWTAEDVRAMLDTYIVSGMRGFRASTLSHALELNASLRSYMHDYKLSVKGLCEHLTTLDKSTNATDVRDVLAVGRAVAVAKAFGIDLISAACSLTSVRSIGKKIPNELQKTDTPWLKSAFRAAIEGKDCKKHLPKRESSKGKDSKAEGQTPDVRPATIGEILETLLARKVELTMEQLTSAVKILAEEVRQRKAGEPVKASEPAAMAS